MVVLLFLFWIVLNGKITFEIVAVGAVVSAVLTYLAHRILAISPRNEVRFLRLLPGVFCYLLYLVGQIILSNFQVIRLILAPETGRPKLVWFELPLKGELAQVALANSITLTPGTVTVSMGKRTICVYALRPEMATGLKESGFVVKLRRLEGKKNG